MKGHNTIIPAAIRGRYVGGKIIQRLEVRPNMCTNTLTGCLLYTSDAADD